MTPLRWRLLFAREALIVYGARALAVTSFGLAIIVASVLCGWYGAKLLWWIILL